MSWWPARSCTRRSAIPTAGRPKRPQGLARNPSRQLPTQTPPDALSQAQFSHLTVLGIEIQGDGGLLFTMAWAAFLGGAVVTFLHRREIPGYVSLSS